MSCEIWFLFEQNYFIMFLLSSKFLLKEIQSHLMHTLKLTNLSIIKKNDLVNVEIDILSKYTKKFINEKK